MLDFLIMYESKNRELEGDVLLGEELKRRGYTVDYIHSHYFRGKKRQAKVMIVPYAYDNYTLYHHVYRICGEQKCIINLRSEQIVAKKYENDYTSWGYPKGEALKMYTVSWGRKETEGLLAAGVRKKRIVETGNINFDSLYVNKEFLGKKRLGEKYNINQDSKWILFISSFSLVGLTSKEEEGMISRIGEEGLNFLKLSKASRDKILEWFKQLLNQEDNIDIIYRRHPAEGEDSELKDMEQKYDRFHVVYNEVISEWIEAAEMVYNWFSTSGVQSLILGKRNVLLRPVEFPIDEDISIFDNDPKISSYDEFARDAIDGNTSISVESRQKYVDYYKLEKGGFYKLADFCEELINKPDADIDCGIDYSNLVGKIRGKERIAYFFMYNLVYPFYSYMYKRKKELSVQMFSGYNEYKKVMDNICSNDEFLEITKKVDRIIAEYAKE